MIQERAGSLRGFIPAPVTPFTEEGKVDFSLLGRQLGYLIESGADGLFMNGTTGEGPYLTRAEKLDILRAAKDAAAGRVFLCAACIQPSTDQVFAELEDTLALEPDFVVAVPPYYYTVPQEAMREHFLALARRSSVPLIIYNIPQCTQNSLSLATILELAKEDNIAGIKDSSGDFATFCRGLLAGAPQRFSWIMGEDYLDGPAMLMGARGIVSGLSNVWAGFHADLYRAALAGDREGVLENQARIDRLYAIHRVTGGQVLPALKAGATLFGRCTPWMRIPSLAMPPGEAALVRTVLESLGLSDCPAKAERPASTMAANPCRNSRGRDENTICI